MKTNEIQIKSANRSIDRLNHKIQDVDEKLVELKFKRKRLFII